KTDLPDRTEYGAKNVEIFLGDGPYRLADGSVNPDAIGVVVTNATLGAVKFTATGKFAIYAYGQAAFVGLDGLTISGHLLDETNETGPAVTGSINLPTTDGSTQQIDMPFLTGVRVEKFAAGVASDGTLDPAQEIEISAAGIFTIKGSV